MVQALRAEAGARPRAMAQLPTEGMGVTTAEAREDVLSWYFGNPPEPVREIPEFVAAVDRLIETVEESVRRLRAPRRVR